MMNLSNNCYTISRRIHIYTVPDLLMTAMGRWSECAGYWGLASGSLAPKVLRKNGRFGVI